MFPTQQLRVMNRTRGLVAWYRNWTVHHWAFPPVNSHGFKDLGRENVMMSYATTVTRWLRLQCQSESCKVQATL